MEYRIVKSDELAHHGILGMKWGVRRYQNPDGSLTAEGKKRYGSEAGLYKSQAKKEAKKSVKNLAKFAGAAYLTEGTGTVAANMTGKMTKMAYGLGKVLSSAAGEEVIGQAVYGGQAAAQVAAFMGQYGTALAAGTTVVGLAAGGYAVYRAAKAINKSVKAHNAKKEGR
jgi:hypothetical protein